MTAIITKGNWQDFESVVMEPQISLQISWSTSIPYLGLWIDERTHSQDYVFAPEPCTGLGDKLASAYENNQVVYIAARETVTWFIDVQIGT